ncbi:MAG: OmpA family protein [Rickettsiales bacterium]|jgi:chemotaxis protein MotB
MRRKPNTLTKKHSKGQADHVDAWLMSYADMITLMFIVVVIAIPVTMNKRNTNPEAPRGEPEHPYHIDDNTGLLGVKTTYDETFRTLAGIIRTNNEEENISIEKSNHGLWLDMSVPFVFEEGSSDIQEEQMPLIKSLIRSLKNTMPPDSKLEIEGYTDDKPLEKSKFANNWELSSMQTARIASLFVDEGIDSKKLRVTSYAGNSPIVPNADIYGKPISKNRIRNQRLIIKLEVPPPVKEPLSF